MLSGVVARSVVVVVWEEVLERRRRLRPRRLVRLPLVRLRIRQYEEESHLRSRPVAGKSPWGGPSPPNSPKSPLFVRVPPYLHTKIFPMGGAMAPLAPPSATGLLRSGMNELRIKGILTLKPFVNDSEFLPFWKHWIKLAVFVSMSVLGMPPRTMMLCVCEQGFSQHPFFGTSCTRLRRSESQDWHTHRRVLLSRISEANRVTHLYHRQLSIQRGKVT